MIKITNQENKIINYLQQRKDQEVGWEELAQFAKDPKSVKLKTIQKSVSDLKKKFVVANQPLPFSVKFIYLSKKEAEVKPAETQTLVQVKKAADGNMVNSSNKHAAQLDFTPDPLGFKRVRTRVGVFQLNDSEWDMFKYFYNNPGRLITISELRDKVMYPNYGSKLPARWFDAVMRVINGMRRQVIGLDKRLLTVKAAETSYLFQ